MNGALKILQQEAELEEIVRLVGPEALPEEDKLILLTARMIREDFLMQSAYHPIDTFSNPKRTHLMLGTIMKFHEVAQRLSISGMLVSEIAASKILPRISRMKDVPPEKFEHYIGELESEMGKIAAEKGGEV
jgi:V/A-type H+-transporting ATPase subunit A